MIRATPGGGGPFLSVSRRRVVRVRSRVLVSPDPALPRAAPPGTEAIVVGAGIAGVSAAVVLAERGVAVTLLEAAPTLGGRLGAWPHILPDGTVQVVEHGFHAFFRHYYTWRAILARIDPALAFLRPVGGYPVISRDWPAEDLTGLPGPPLNLPVLFARSPSLGLRDLLRSDQLLACELLAYDRVRTTSKFDAVPAAAFLRDLGLSDRAQAMLFEAFARSFFAQPGALSAAELIAMFHYYFLGNPEGIGFDAPDTDHRAAIWDPLQAHLERHGTKVLAGAPARRLTRDGDAWLVETDAGAHRAPHVVLALDPGALRALVAASQIDGPLAHTAAACAVAPPFAVTRLWLDRDVAPSRPTFSAVSREPTLDSVTVYSRLERPSAEWALRTGGSVIELHSYACTAPDAASATSRMRAELAALWPETAAAGVVGIHDQFAATAPTFPPGGAGTRPTVVSGEPGLRVAGDFVETPLVCGLMERAAVTGVLAANDVLDAVGARGEEIVGVPQRGLLAGWLPG
jgi:carotenoid phi-ring synthase / carotenoid chi-ring synthase